MYYSPTRITPHLQILSNFLFLFSHRVISTFGWQGTHNANHEHTYLEQLDGVLICTNPFIIVVYNTHEKETLSSDHGLVSQVGPVVARGGGSLQLKFGTKKHFLKKVFKRWQNIFPYYWLLLIHVSPAAVVSRVGILLLLRHRRRGRGLRQGL